MVNTILSIFRSEQKRTFFLCGITTLWCSSYWMSAATNHVIHNDSLFASTCSRRVREHNTYGSILIFSAHKFDVTGLQDKNGDFRCRLIILLHDNAQVQPFLPNAVVPKRNQAKKRRENAHIFPLWATILALHVAFEKHQEWCQTQRTPFLCLENRSSHHITSRSDFCLSKQKLVDLQKSRSRFGLSPECAPVCLQTPYSLVCQKRKGIKSSGVHCGFLFVLQLSTQKTGRIIHGCPLYLGEYGMLNHKYDYSQSSHLILILLNCSQIKFLPRLHCVLFVFVKIHAWAFGRLRCRGFLLPVSHTIRTWFGAEKNVPEWRSGNSLLTKQIKCN